MSVNYTSISTVFNVVKGLALILTLFRLGFRFKIQRFWWEDMWAAVASLCTAASIISVLAVSGTDKDEPIQIAGKISVYMFTSIVWSVRMSLIFSVVRISYSTPMRRITLAVAACFVLLWATILSLQVWWCGIETGSLPRANQPVCILPRFMIIFQVIANCLADTASVIFPIKLLWRVKLPARQRRMVLSLFTTSRFLCLFSLAYSISQLVGSESIQVILADLQLCAFMIVCNLLVVVTYIYRVCHRPSQEELSSVSDSSDDDDFTTPVRNTSTQDLTTVDLESLCTSITVASTEEKGTPFPSSTHIAEDERWIPRGIVDVHLDHCTAGDSA